MKIDKWLPVKLIGILVYVLFIAVYLQDGEHFLAACSLFVATMIFCSMFKFFDLIWRYL